MQQQLPYGHSQSSSCIRQCSGLVQWTCWRGGLFIWKEKDVKKKNWPLFFYFDFGAPVTVKWLVFSTYMPHNTDFNSDLTGRYLATTCYFLYYRIRKPGGIKIHLPSYLLLLILLSIHPTSSLSISPFTVSEEPVRFKFLFPSGL